jgi:hypothetical protein
LTIGTSTLISDSGATDQFQTSNAAANKFFFNAATYELWYSPNGTGDKVDLAHVSTGVAATDIHALSDWQTNIRNPPE